MVGSRVKFIFTFNEMEVIGELKRLHNEEFHALCSSPNIVTAIE
jgi:hypothetical protein